MSRWIDAEWLYNELGDINMDIYTDEVKEYIDSAPHIEIIRCGECKYNKNPCINHGEMSPRCRYANYKRSADDFCSHGEREGE